MVQQVLAESGLSLKQLDAIAFLPGPGSFTSLRIGAGVVQGLAFGANLPVVPVSSLAVLAQGVDAPKVLAAFDARMNQVYWGAYVRDDKGLMRLAGTEIVIAPADVPARGFGVGWSGEWVGSIRGGVNCTPRQPCERMAQTGVSQSSSCCTVGLGAS